MRVIMSTPEGIEQIESNIVSVDVSITPKTSIEVWRMKRTDSEGTDYLRSTADVEGYGVVDIARYTYEYGSTWFVASDGMAIFPREVGTWVPTSDGDTYPWKPYFYG